MRIGAFEKREMAKGIFDPDKAAPAPRRRREMKTPCEECNRGGEFCLTHFVQAVRILAGNGPTKIGPFKTDERYAALYAERDLD